MSQLFALDLQGVVTERVVAIRVGEFFGVFFCSRGWNLTHAATGFAIVKDCCCPIHAIAIAEHIAPMLDWTADKREINEQGKRIELPRILRKFPCPACDPTARAKWLSSTVNSPSPDVQEERKD